MIKVPKNKNKKTEKKSKTQSEKKRLYFQDKNIKTDS